MHRASSVLKLPISISFALPLLRPVCHSGIPTPYILRCSPVLRSADSPPTVCWPSVSRIEEVSLWERSVRHPERQATIDREPCNRPALIPIPRKGPKFLFSGFRPARVFSVALDAKVRYRIGGGQITPRLRPIRPRANHAVAARVRDRLPQARVLIFENQHQRVSSSCPSEQFIGAAGRCRKSVSLFAD